MTLNITEVLLWLFVINLGIACGAGLYEIRIVASPWIDSVLRASLRAFPTPGQSFGLSSRPCPLHC
jgi:hypothetical protein